MNLLCSVINIRFKFRAKLQFVVHILSKCESVCRSTNGRCSCTSCFFARCRWINHAHRWDQRGKLVIHSAKQQYERLYRFLRKRATWRDSIAVKSRVESVIRSRAVYGFSEWYSVVIGFVSYTWIRFLVSSGASKGYTPLVGSFASRNCFRWVTEQTVRIFFSRLSNYTTTHVLRF